LCRLVSPNGKHPLLFIERKRR